MPARRKTSPRQMYILLEFAESNRNIALDRLKGGLVAHQATREAWISIANQLNAVAESSTKTPDQWRRYWIQFKAKTKSKVESRRNALAAGRGPNELVPLSNTEKRVLAIMRREERVPRWFYDLEERRITAMERFASEIEAIVELIREIKDDICSHISGSSREQT